MVVTTRSKRVALSPVEMDGANFDSLCAAKDAKTEAARAELVKVDRRTLLRWRNETVTPSLDAAFAAAAALGTQVERIWRLRKKSSQ